MFEVWLHIKDIYYPHDGNLDKPPTFDLSRHLHRQEISKFGLKKSVIFYADYEEESDKYYLPLCTITWKTIFDGATPKKQVKYTSWLIDGKMSLLDKFELKIEKPKIFMQKMRSRVIEELIDLGDKSGLGDKLKALYENHSKEIYIYKEGGSPKFRDAIYSSKEQWLDLPSADQGTVRDVIFQYLSIGVVDSEAD